MADFHINVSVALVAAVVLGEVLSTLWYSHVTPWGHYWGDRYFITSIVCDILLACMLSFLMKNYWSVSRPEDAAFLATFLSLIFFCLQAPHAVHNGRSFSNFFVHSLHKTALMFVMSFSLFYFRNY